MSTHQRIAENIQYLLGHIEQIKEPIGALEAKEILGCGISAAREILNKCHGMGLLQKRAAGPKCFSGNRVIYERTEKPYVPLTQVGCCAQDFSGLLSAFSIPLIAPSGVRGKIHKLSWGSEEQVEADVVL